MRFGVHRFLLHSGAPLRRRRTAVEECEMGGGTDGAAAGSARPRMFPPREWSVGEGLVRRQSTQSPARQAPQR